MRLVRIEAEGVIPVTHNAVVGVVQDLPLLIVKCRLVSNSAFTDQLVRDFETHSDAAYLNCAHFSNSGDKFGKNIEKRSQSAHA
jgi:hypothetical protein